MPKADIRLLISAKVLSLASSPQFCVTKMSWPAACENAQPVSRKENQKGVKQIFIDGKQSQLTLVHGDSARLRATKAGVLLLALALCLLHLHNLELLFPAAQAQDDFVSRGEHESEENQAEVHGWEMEDMVVCFVLRISCEGLSYNNSLSHIENEASNLQDHWHCTDLVATDQHSKIADDHQAQKDEVACFGPTSKHTN